MIISTKILLIIIGFGIPLAILFSSVSNFIKKRRDTNFKFQVISKNSGKIFILYPRGTLGRRGSPVLLFLLPWFLFRMIYNSDVRLIEFGIKSNYSFLISFISGICIFLIFTPIWNQFIKLIKSDSFIRVNNYLVTRQIIPRTKIGKSYFILNVCILVPFVEEILLRGILVYFIGSVFNIYWLTILLGLIFWVGIHLYQGIINVYFHFVFYIISIVLLFSPLGLVACLGLHFAANIFYVYNIPKSLKEFREENRIIYGKAV